MDVTIDNSPLEQALDVQHLVSSGKICRAANFMDFPEKEVASINPLVLIVRRWYQAEARKHLAQELLAHCRQSGLN